MLFQSGSGEGIGGSVEFVPSNVVSEVTKVEKFEQKMKARLTLIFSIIKPAVKMLTEFFSRTTNIKHFVT